MYKNKRYNLDFIIDICEIYKYKVQVCEFGIIVSPVGEDAYYKPNIMCYVDDDKYEEDIGFYITRFSIGFDGFGNVKTRELENLIFDNIINAKTLVDTLNKYIDQCNENLNNINNN